MSSGSQEGANSSSSSSSSSWWGWGDSLLQTVKKQSETIISIYKEDLSEFTRTIKEDTLNVVKEVVVQTETHDQCDGRTSDSTSSSPPPAAAAAQATSTSAKQAKQGGLSATSSSGLANFFSFMESLKDEGDEEDEEVIAKSRREKCVKKLQKDPNTYTKEPEDMEDFKMWQARFNLEAHTVEISQLLSANPKLRALHNELLPTLTYTVFWERYYYRLEKVLKEEERREKILMRAELDSKLEDWDGWEDDEEEEEEEDVDPDHKHEEQQSAVEQTSLEHETDSSANRFGDQSSEAESSITVRDDQGSGTDKAQSEVPTGAGSASSDDASIEVETAPAVEQRPSTTETSAIPDEPFEGSSSSNHQSPAELTTGEETENKEDGASESNINHGRGPARGDEARTCDGTQEEEEKEEAHCAEGNQAVDLSDAKREPEQKQEGEEEDDWGAWE